MIQVLALYASALGYPNVPTKILQAIEVACSKEDPDCEADAVLYAAHESGFDAHPKAWSWDAKAGVSCGYWQTPCRTLPKTVTGQAEAWVAMRRSSLKSFGDLRGLAGATPAGERLARARKREREDVVFAATWAAPSTEEPN